MTTRESDKFMLRLPAGMRDELKAAAAANNRSMNAEIVHRLQGLETIRAVALAHGYTLTPVGDAA